jgi:hypothetical protein
MALKGDGNLLIVAQLGHAVFSMAPSGSIQRVFGTGIRTGSIDGEGGDSRDDLGDGRQAAAASLNFPTAIVIDAGGNSYVADKNNHRVRRVDGVTGIITTVAGTGAAGSSGDGGPATSAQVNLPSGLALDSAGNLYIAEQGGNRVRKVTPGGTISRVAGTGSYGYSGDDGLATYAKLASPFGLATDGAGSLYIADANNHRIRKVSSSGVITTVAGNGSPEFSGDGGASIGAGLNEPLGVAVDCAGNMAIADAYNHRIRRVESVIGLSVSGDGDGDGVSDCQELALGTNPFSADTDGDGFKDKPDTSFAGVNTNPNVDNCPLVYNPDQVNSDAKTIDNGPVVAGDDVTVPSGDSLGDGCDPDDDNDWMQETGTNARGVPGEDVGCNGSGPTNPLKADSDGDAVVDGAECLLGSNPNDANSSPSCAGIVDSDRDCLPDNVEALFGSNPNIRDMDGDGLNDATEVKGWGTSPTNRDSDGDGCDDDKEAADVNGDKMANGLDRLLVLRRAAKIQDDDPNDGDPNPDYNMVVSPAFDVQKDGKVDNADGLWIAKNSYLSPTERFEKWDCR